MLFWTYIFWKVPDTSDEHVTVEYIYTTRNGCLPANKFKYDVTVSCDQFDAI